MDERPWMKQGEEAPTEKAGRRWFLPSRWPFTASAFGQNNAPAQSPTRARGGHRQHSGSQACGVENGVRDPQVCRLRVGAVVSPSPTGEFEIINPSGRTPTPPRGCYSAR